MRLKVYVSLAVCLSLFCNKIIASEPIYFTSSNLQTNIINCIPLKAVALALQLRQSSRNYLGWADVFSNSEYFTWQHQHNNYSNLKSVYTLAFVVNGSEWRGFYNYNNKFPISSNNSGVLSAMIFDKTVEGSQF